MFSILLLNKYYDGALFFLYPFRFLRRGRAAKSDDPDFDDEYDIVSDVDDSELVSWLEKPGQSSAFQLVNPSDDKKMTKFLPPGNVMQLYQHYSSTCRLLGVKLVSSLSQLIVYLLIFLGMFLRVIIFDS